jgi:relA/spoT family protein
MPPYKAVIKSNETLEIFAPIAERLGIFKIKWEMEDIALRYIEPDFYFDMRRQIIRRLYQRESYISDMIDFLKETLAKEMPNSNFEIYGREKNLYSIYKKMKFKNKSFEEIYDFLAIRVIVQTKAECYGVLGIVHGMWKPIPDRNKDYIGNPKANNYQSLHTTVFGPGGELVEVQIRTEEMHKTAEYGIAAHWKYKQGKIDTHESEMDKKLAWLRQIMDWQKEVTDPNEYMKSLKTDLYSHQVFVFTPKGDIIELPAGSTPIDMAYKIHTNVGNKCVGAKINNKIVPLDTVIKNGQIIEILTSANSKGPSRDWLNIVQSSHTKSKIKQWFKKEKREENIEKGRELLESTVKKLGYPMADFLRNKALQAVEKPLSQPNDEELYAAIGYGGLTINQVMIKLKEVFERDFADKLKELKEKQLEDLREKQKEAHTKKEIKQERYNSNKQLVNVKGLDNILTRLAKCCNPIPGDDIVGYITKDRGVTVHRSDCTNVIRDSQNSSKELVEVHWNNVGESNIFDVEVQIKAYNRPDLIYDISGLFKTEKINILALNTRKVERNTAIIDLSFEVRTKEQMKKTINKLKAIEDVHEVYRISK